MPQIEMAGTVQGIGSTSGTASVKYSLTGTAKGKGLLLSGAPMRTLSYVGAVEGEIFYGNEEGFLVPTDVLSLTDGKSPVWDEPTKEVQWQTPGGGTVTEPEALLLAVSDEVNAITTGTAKLTFRMPFGLTLTAVRANLKTASSSGVVTVDINENGSSILSTKLTIDATEKTSTTAATPPVISDSALADDAEITIDIDTAGTGAVGLKVTLIGERES